MSYYPRVLIADDDAGIREVLVTLTRNTLPSAKITAVENGRKALEHFKRHGADLLISNFKMPEMDGPELVENLRVHGEELPIIMVSGSPRAEVEGRHAGIDRFINKYDLIEFLPREIRTLLGPEKVMCLNRYLHG